MTDRNRTFFPTLAKMGDDGNRNTDGTFRKGHELRFDRKDRSEPTKTQRKRWDFTTFFSDFECSNGIRYRVHVLSTTRWAVAVWPAVKRSRVRVFEFSKLAELRRFVVHARQCGAVRK